MNSVSLSTDVKNPLVHPAPLVGTSDTHYETKQTVASLLETGQVYEALERTEHERRWRDGVCDCFNNFYPSLVCSFFAPIIYTGQMLEKLSERPKTCIKFVSAILLGNVAAILVYPYSEIGGQITAGLVNVYVFYMMAETRRLARERYAIPAGVCEDSLMTVCLTQCTLAQTGRKVYEYDKICDDMKSCERG